MLTLIIFIILSILFGILAYKADEYDRCSLCGIFSGLLCIFSCTLSIILAGCLICAPFDHMEFKSKYEQAKTYTYNVAPQIVAKNTIQINNEILNARTLNKSLWTKGLMSKKTGELELLEIPK